MKCVKGLGFLWVAVLAAFFALSACDDSSSASSNGPDENAAVDSSSSICKDCDDESSSSTKKIESSAEEAGSSSRTTSSKSSSSGKTAFSGLSDSGASSSSIEKKSSTSTEDMACSKEGYIKSVWDRASQSWVDYICSNNYYIPASEYVPSSSSKYPIMDSVFNSELSYGEFEDPRDHQVYKTKKGTLPGGEQEIEVFAQNLNFGKWVKSTDIVADDDTVKYCYDDDEWYCKNYFGGLYSWAETMGFSDACNYHVLNTAECPFTLNGRDYTRQHRGICPEGWHITNKEEWVAIVGEGKTWSVISKVHGEDNYTGTSVLFSGSSGAYGKHYDGFGHMAAYHLPAVLDGDGVEKDSLHPVVAFHDFDYNRSFNSYTYNPSSRKYQNFSVRCTKDYIYKE